MIYLIAQSSSTTLFRLMLALAAFVVVAGVLLAVLSTVRRRMQVDHGVARDFTLAQLRELHREGKLTDEELNRAKAKLVASEQAKLARQAKPPARKAPFGSTEVK